MSDLEKQLGALVKQATDALTEAEAFADEHGLAFNFYPAYGMGGTYMSLKAYLDEQGYDTEEEWKEDHPNTYRPLEERIGWQSSSSNC